MGTDDARKLFVAGLPESITEDVLRELFEATGGTVVNVSLPKDRMTGRPRGFGFVTFSSADEAQAARDALDGSMQSGRAISVRPFSSEPPKRGEARTETAASPIAGGGGGDRTVYVGNLPYDINQQEVESLFIDNGAGPVLRVHLPAGPDGRPRGFGFVTLGSGDAANQAISALRNVELRGRRLTVNLALPRGERPERGPDRGDRPERPRPAFGARPDGGGAFERHEAPQGDSFDGPAFEGPAFDGGRLLEESSKPLEGRRARSGEWAEGSKKKKKKEKKKRGASAEKSVSARRERGGAGSWKQWGEWDDD